MNQSLNFTLTGLVVSMLVACGSDTQTTANAGAGSGTGGAPAQGGGANGAGKGGMLSGGGSAQTNGGGGSGSGGNNASGAASGGRPAGIYPVGSCTDAVLRTAPEAGKEIFKADPISTQFPFSSHWMGSWGGPTEPVLMGQTVFADLDDDGDLDFAAGQRDVYPGGMFWWEQCSADHWVRHKVGTGQKSDSSGDALDVDKDGLIDILTGDSWFKNPGRSREMEWERIDAGTKNAEDLVVGDVTGDGMAEVLYVNNDFKPEWYKIGATPENGFMLGGVLDHNIQQGVAWGDLNGDGANDWLISSKWWYENDGTGTTFTERAITATAVFDANASSHAPLTYVGDLDGDGDNDFAMSSHWMGGTNAAKLAWVENLDGKGTSWEMHMLSQAGMYTHGVILADFDNDKDLDIFWARNVGPSFIYENTGNKVFVERKIVNDFRGHTPRAGDADCDGDLDIAGGPWGDQGPADHGEQDKPIRDYVYLKNLAVEGGATPIFDAARQPYELGWREKNHCLR